MLSLFKRRDWKPEVLSELKRTNDGLTVVLRNFTCLIDTNAGKRKYPHLDFGAEFLLELTNRQLGDFEHVRRVLSAGAGKTAYVRLRDFGAIEVQVTGRASHRREQFYSDLADALIAAFDTHRIKP